MAKVEIKEVNYKGLSEALGLEMKVGRKNVRMENKICFVSGVITDKEKELATIDWITAERSSDITYEQIEAQVKAFAAGEPIPELVPNKKSEVQESKSEDKTEGENGSPDVKPSENQNSEEQEENLDSKEDESEESGNPESGSDENREVV